MLGSVTAQRVDAAVDRLQRLLDGLLAQVTLDGRLHPELVIAARLDVPIVVGARDLVRAVRNCASRSGGRPRRGTSSARDADVADGDRRSCSDSRSCSLVDVVVAQRVVGVDLQTSWTPP
jgi:hypothetical protein